MNDFISLLLGHYSNKDQAWSNPSKWSYVHILFELLPDGHIQSKSWYDYQSSQNPYRQSLHTVTEERGFILLNTHTKMNGVCSMEFKKNDNVWSGICYDCPINDKEYLTTEVKFDGMNYYSREGAYDMSTHLFLWGKKKSEPMFHFKRIK